MATPIVGLLSDKYNLSCGKRNTFYIVGTIIVIPSFLCIFTAPIWANFVCRDVWYVVWPMIFNVGWAAVQVSHMSVLNSLTYCQAKRDQMINSRNGFTYAANIAMLSFSLALFIFEKHSLMQFRVLSITCAVLGSIASLFYMFHINEKSLAAEAISKEQQFQSMPSHDLSFERSKQLDWKAWLRMPQFYNCGLIYMSSRVALNVTATLMPLYLTRALGFSGDRQLDTSFAIAAVPLYLYICSMLFSVFCQARVQSRTPNSRAPLMMIALVITALSSLPMIVLEKEDWCKHLIYPCACLQGISIALMLNTSTQMISDVIGSNTQSAAFVYGTYSFVDKTINGLFLYWLISSYSMSA